MTRPLADAVMPDVVVRARPEPPRLSQCWRRSPSSWRLATIAALAGGPVMAVVGHVPAVSGFGVTALVPAALIDAHSRRLPNRWVGAAALVVAVTALVEGVLGTPVDAGGTLIGAVVFAGPMLALHLLSPTAMGFGDVKAGAVLGACLGAIDWRLALAGLALASGTTACVAIARGRSTVAFGPGLVLGTLVALVAHTTFVAPSSSDDDTSPVVTVPIHLRPQQEAHR